MFGEGAIVEVLVVMVVVRSSAGKVNFIVGFGFGGLLFGGFGWWKL